MKLKEMETLFNERTVDGLRSQRSIEVAINNFSKLLTVAIAAKKCMQAYDDIYDHEMKMVEALEELERE